MPCLRQVVAAALQGAQQLPSQAWGSVLPPFGMLWLRQEASTFVCSNTLSLTASSTMLLNARGRFHLR